MQHPSWSKLKELALQTIETTIEELPEELRRQARLLPVTFEKTPDPCLQNDGIEPDTLGMFSGHEFAPTDGDCIPPQITLFLLNLWDFSGNDEQVYQIEVRTTYLHEFGHFFGLEETDLEDRGLA